MQWLAITDYNGMYGCIEHYKYCMKSHITPILGIELSRVDNSSLKNKQEDTHNIVLLAKTMEWYKNLLEITSYANLQWWNWRARVDNTILKKHNEGIICLLWGNNSVLAHRILHKQNYTHILESFIDIYEKKNIVLECLVWDESIDDSISSLNKELIHLSDIYNVTITCSPNVHIIHEKDKEMYEIFLCIKDNKRIFENDRPKITQPIRLMSEKEILDQMMKNWYNKELILKMMENTNIILKQISVTIELWNLMFPIYKNSPEIQKLFQIYSNHSWLWNS